MRKGKFMDERVALALLLPHGPRARLAIIRSQGFSPARHSSGRIAHRAAALGLGDLDGVTRGRTEVAKRNGNFSNRSGLPGVDD